MFPLQNLAHKELKIKKYYIYQNVWLLFCPKLLEILIFHFYKDTQE